MSYTASNTWVSFDAKQHEIFVKMRDNMLHIAPHSPFVPQKFDDWIAYRLAVVEDAHHEANGRLAVKRTEKRETKERIQPPLGGKKFRDFLSCVMSRASIWINDGPGRPLAPWPSHDELKHEGYQRNKSGYQRFPPLPRVSGNSTVNWKQRAPIGQFPFDEVGRPTLASSEEPPETDSHMEFLVGYGLLDQISLKDRKLKWTPEILDRALH
ncbi:hypothetical protein Egran_05962 [Elaphomyces granulatus]|uniref:Uncharacterized protein n=1 Tax=Elaphomyces granulatus TaxID=519963 RepID=A0A232LQ56_9EURO|nr:hypothetical protein Egran_05962 [Elaphomyces granulatus]